MLDSNGSIRLRRRDRIRADLQGKEYDIAHEKRNQQQYAFRDKALLKEDYEFWNTFTPNNEEQ